MTGTYVTHEAEHLSRRESQEDSMAAKIWEVKEYIDIAFELEFPRHLNTHKHTFLISFGFENNDVTEIGSFART